MRFASINEDRVSTVNIKRGCIVKIGASNFEWMVVKRTHGRLFLRRFDDTPIPSRRSMGGTNAHTHQARIEDVVKVAISR